MRMGRRTSHALSAISEICGQFFYVQINMVWFHECPLTIELIDNRLPIAATHIHHSVLLPRDSGNLIQDPLDFFLEQGIFRVVALQFLQEMERFLLLVLS
jgi:hypothetical protein